MSTGADDEAFSSLLELAANNDVETFKFCVDRSPSAVDEAGLWYGRSKGSKQMILDNRTPLMVAATYGSIDVLELLIGRADVDVNGVYGLDESTALHCAASGGSFNAVEAIKMLIDAGADPNLVDANGLRSVDMIVVHPKLSDGKNLISELLCKNYSSLDGGGVDIFNVDSSPGSSSLDHDSNSSGGLVSSPVKMEKVLPEKKEYPVDLSFPDIKNSIYGSDEFRMFSFKVRPCSRAYSHDWTECPFVHPGENARRRDPRKYHYSCVPCPDFRKGTCRHGDMCEYAHGVFESWLHPAQYRTRLCKDGLNCSRRVCFFAHAPDELRPLYPSTGSGVLSPRSAASSALEMAAAMGLAPGSSSEVSGVFSSFTPPMSPGNNAVRNSTIAWPQPNVPVLHLPTANLHASRLRASLSARDMLVDDFAMIQDFESQKLMNDLCRSQLSTSPRNHSMRVNTLTPPNLDDFFSAGIMPSPRYNSDHGAIFSPSHRTAMLNQFQHQQHNLLLSPINNNVFSPKNVDAHHLPGHSTLVQATHGMPLSEHISPRAFDSASLINSRQAALTQQEKQQKTMQCFTSTDLGSATSPIIGSPTLSSLPKGALSLRNLDWGMNGEKHCYTKQSSSTELLANSQEPDLSWVHTLVKETPQSEKVATPATASVKQSVLGSVASTEISNSNTQIDDDVQAAFLGAWLEQLQFDKELTK